jgi:hypothetical protein
MLSNFSCLALNALRAFTQVLVVIGEIYAAPANQASAWPHFRLEKCAAGVFNQALAW